MDIVVPTDTRTEPFAPGDTVALRSVNTYGRHGEAVGFAVAGRVLVDDEELAVVATLAGSAVRRRAGAGSGPNGRLVVPDDWDGTYVEDGWFGAPVVRVHRKGTPWSVWRWHDGTDWEPDWYINLELPWTRTELGFDSQDWTLDVVASSTADGTWSVRYKDQDELAFSAGLGLWPAAMRSTIESVGAAATAAAEARGFPFDVDWSAWVPDQTWPPVALPAGWDRLDRDRV